VSWKSVLPRCLSKQEGHKESEDQLDPRAVRAKRVHQGVRDLKAMLEKMDQRVLLALVDLRVSMARTDNKAHKVLGALPGLTVCMVMTVVMVFQSLTQRLTSTVTSLYN